MKPSSIALLLVSVVGLSWGGFVQSAHAQALPIQGVHSDNQIGQSNSNGSYDGIQTLGTNFQGTLTEIVLWQKKTNGTLPATVQVYECTSSSYSSCTSLGSANGTVPNNVTNGSNVSYIFGSAITLSASKYYAIRVSHLNGSGNTVRYYGSNSDVYPNGTATSTLPGAGITTSSVTLSDFYFQLKGELWSEELGFVGSVYPVAFSATTSPVSFDLVYYLDEITFPTQYLGVGYNYDTGESTTTPLYSLPSTTTGVFNHAYPSNTFSNGSWSVTWWLKDPTNTYETVGRPIETTFSINATTSFFQTPTIQGINTSYASTSCAINFLGTFSLSECVRYLIIPSSNIYSLYGNIPKLLGSKFPFSYITSIQNTWKELTASAGTAPTLTYNLHDIGIGSTTPLGNFLPNVEIFSEDTVTTYLNPTILEIFKSLVATVLIALTFLNIYAHSMRLLKHT